MKIIFATILLLTGCSSMAIKTDSNPEITNRIDENKCMYFNINELDDQHSPYYMAPTLGVRFDF